MSEIIHALIFLINVLLPSLDLMLVYHKSTPHTILQAPVLKFSLRSASSLFTDPLFSLQSPSSVRIKDRNCFARVLAGVSKWTKRKKKIVCVQARLYLNVFLPKKPAFGNSRGPWGEGRNEGGKRYFFRFPFILRVLTFEFFIVFFVCCGERFSVILRKWAMYATARARDEQKFDEICHLFDCLRLYTSGLLC